MNTKRSEKGQAIVLILIAMVAMLAFVALAVDGGRVFSERRRLQNAADAAAYAAAQAAAFGDDAIQAALAQAALNDVVDSDGGVNSLNVIDVIVNTPPQHGQYIGDDEYYEVVIRTKSVPSFSGIVKADTSVVEAFAVSHVQDIETVTGESAVFALSSSGNGITIGTSSATTTVNLTGGDIFSNSGIKKNKSTSAVNVTNGKIKLRGKWTDKTKVKPAPIEDQPKRNKPNVVEPLCPSTQRSLDGKTLSPGFYAHEVWMGSSNTYTLKPGIYCFYNGWVVSSGATVNITGKDVLLVMLNGEIKLDGNGTIRLARADSIKDGRGNEYGGMLVYVSDGPSILPPGTASASPVGSGAACGGTPSLVDPFFTRLFGNLLGKTVNCPQQTKNVFLSGNGSSSYWGTVYNPDHKCTAEGGSNVTIDGNLVCNEITLQGKTVTLKHRPNTTYRLPPSIELSE